MCETSECLTNEEPLGYQHFLYDVNIEYNLGGHRAESGSNCLSFKLKCLPYMMSSKDNRWWSLQRKASLTSSDSSNCDDSFSSPSQNSSLHSSPILLDVGQQTCAFLSNSEFVPRQHLDKRRVVLEIISAKLSQPINATPTSSPLAERSRLVAPSLLSSDTSFRIPISPARHRTNIVPPVNSPPPISNKRYVNYTLLIKTVPGLDKHPAVIERRFSDFLFLYRGLKAKKCFAVTVDKHVSFPRKVYMGNFSLHNIAERSLEFSKLLTLCMSNTGIMWSKSFVSFILDKELKEAHQLSLVGDLDELQALIEIPHRIVQKLFLQSLHHMDAKPLPNFNNANNNIGPSTTTNNSLDSSINQSYSDTSLQSTTSSDSTVTLSESACDTNSNIASSYNYSHIKGVSPSLNERLLVIFCILFFTYYQSENYAELKQTVQDFSLLISSQAYLDSLAAPRHYTPLRACLIFLIGLKDISLMEEDQRARFAKKLEDLDNSHKNLSPLRDTSSPLKITNNKSSSVESMVKALRGFDWNLSSDTYDM